MNDDIRDRYMDLVKTLESFGHRGSATENESRAAEFLVDELAKTGITAVREPFSSCRSLGVRLALPVIVVAIGAGLVWCCPALTIGLGLVGLVSIVLEESTRLPVLGRLLPQHSSGNVVGRIPASNGRASRRVVVVGHYDTPRTGWIWKEGLAGKIEPFLAKAPGIVKSPLFLVMLAMVAQPILGVVALFRPASAAVTVMAIVSLVVFSIAICLLLQWSAGAQVPGANDNASGAAAAVAIAEKWLSGPVENVELILLLTGCEETGLLGAKAFIQAHRRELREIPTVFLNFDAIGRGRPRFIGKEHSLVGEPRRYPPEQIEICRQVAQEEGLHDAGPHTLPVFTDGFAFLIRGIPGVSILSFEDGFHIPNYHLPSDTADNIDFDVAWSAVQFGWKLLRRLAVIDNATFFTTTR